MSLARVVTSVVVLVVSTFTLPVAGAQGIDGATSRRPFRGLFAGDDAAPTDRSAMTLAISALGEYNNPQDVHVDGLEVSDRSGIDPGIQASVTYRRPRPRFQFAWAADAHARRGPVATGPFTGETMVTLSARLTRRASMHVGQRLAYVPQTLFGAAPRFQNVSDGIDEIAVMPVHRVTAESLAHADSTAGFTYEFSEASALTLEYGHQRAMNLEAGSSVAVGNRVAARLTRRIRRSISTRLGYGVHVGAYDVDGARQQVRTHDLDIGVDYGRTISLTRRTRFTFATGTAIIGGDGRAAEAPRNRTAMRATGTAALVRDLGRTWTTRVSYDRGVQLSDRIAAVALTDTAGVSVNGLLGRRVAAAASTAFTTGQLRPGAEGDSYESLTALAQLHVALTRRWALFVDYSLYAYRFVTTAQLPVSLPSERNHSSARAGVTWRAPVRH